jgi:hypothetical protein
MYMYVQVTASRSHFVMHAQHAVAARWSLSPAQVALSLRVLRGERTFLSISSIKLYNSLHRMAAVSASPSVSTPEHLTRQMPISRSSSSLMVGVRIASAV